MAKFQEFVLRRLYNPAHAGRGDQGTVRRKEFKITLTPKTYLALEGAVRVGPGLYGSAAMELCARVALAIMDRIDLAVVAEELALAVDDRSGVINNLRLLADAIEQYKETYAPRVVD